MRLTRSKNVLHIGMKCSKLRRFLGPVKPKTGFQQLKSSLQKTAINIPRQKATSKQRSFIYFIASNHQCTLYLQLIKSVTCAHSHTEGRIMAWIDSRKEKMRLDNQVPEIQGARF